MPDKVSTLWYLFQCCITVSLIILGVGVTAFLHQYYKESDLPSFYSQYFPELSGVHAPENKLFLDWLYLLGETENPPFVFSTSYGEDETSVELTYAERMNQEIQKTSLRGISFLFASGTAELEL